MEEQLERELRFHLDQRESELILAGAHRNRHGAKPGLLSAVRSK